MKIILSLFLFMGMLASPAVFAQTKIVKTQFKVYGNCVLCKKRIETALDHKGIKQAAWNVKTKYVDVVYNSSRITELEIHQLIAAAGHDTDKVRAKDETYAALPFCCLYREGEDSPKEHVQ